MDIYVFAAWVALLDTHIYVVNIISVNLLRNCKDDIKIDTIEDPNASKQNNIMYNKAAVQRTLK
jgi:hypothetical protein